MLKRTLASLAAKSVIGQHWPEIAKHRAGVAGRLLRRLGLGAALVAGCAFVPAAASAQQVRAHVETVNHHGGRGWGGHEGRGAGHWDRGYRYGGGHWHGGGAYGYPAYGGGLGLGFYLGTTPAYGTPGYSYPAPAYPYQQAPYQSAPYQPAP